MTRQKRVNNPEQRERLFLDTSYVQALLNNNDEYHARAVALFLRVQSAETWITEAVMLEIGNAFSRLDHTPASVFIQECYKENTMHVVRMSTDLLLRALRIYEQRDDQTWGLVDCISYLVMQDNWITAAVTTDRHFIQMGFQALMREDQKAVQESV